ncbi:hypothetical protein DIPPA_10662 [Diplonema papillatum]|nr:hypothetical protein DIPPA_10662 [Diplonema papillatum]
MRWGHEATAGRTPFEPEGEQRGGPAAATGVARAGIPHRGGGAAAAAGVNASSIWAASRRRQGRSASPGDDAARQRKVLQRESTTGALSPQGPGSHRSPPSSTTTIVLPRVLSEPPTRVGTVVETPTTDGFWAPSHRNERMPTSPPSLARFDGAAPAAKPGGEAAKRRVAAREKRRPPPAFEQPAAAPRAEAAALPAGRSPIFDSSRRRAGVPAPGTADAAAESPSTHRNPAAGGGPKPSARRLSPEPQATDELPANAPLPVERHAPCSGGGARVAAWGEKQAGGSCRMAAEGRASVLGWSPIFDSQPRRGDRSAAVDGLPLAHRNASAAAPAVAKPTARRLSPEPQATDEFPSNPPSLVEQRAPCSGGGARMTAWGEKQAGGSDPKAAEGGRAAGASGWSPIFDSHRRREDLSVGSSEAARGVPNPAARRPSPELLAAGESPSNPPSLVGQQRPAETAADAGAPSAAWCESQPGASDRTVSDGALSRAPLAAWCESQPGASDRKVSDGALSRAPLVAWCESQPGASDRKVSDGVLSRAPLAAWCESQPGASDRKPSDGPPGALPVGALGRSPIFISDRCRLACEDRVGAAAECPPPADRDAAGAAQGARRLSPPTNAPPTNAPEPLPAGEFPSSPPSLASAGRGAEHATPGPQRAPAPVSNPFRLLPDAASHLPKHRSSRIQDSNPTPSATAGAPDPKPSVAGRLSPQPEVGEPDSDPPLASASHLASHLFHRVNQLEASVSAMRRGVPPTEAGESDLPDPKTSREREPADEGQRKGSAAMLNDVLAALGVLGTDRWVGSGGWVSERVADLEQTVARLRCDVDARLSAIEARLAASPPPARLRRQVCALAGRAQPCALRRAFENLAKHAARRGRAAALGARTEAAARRRGWDALAARRARAAAAACAARRVRGLRHRSAVLLLGPAFRRLRRHASSHEPRLRASWARWVAASRVRSRRRSQLGKTFHRLCDRMKRLALERCFSKLKHYSTLRKLDAKLRQVLNLSARYTDEKCAAAAAQAEAQRKRGEWLVDERLADVSDQLRRATSASETQRTESMLCKALAQCALMEADGGGRPADYPSVLAEVVRHAIGVQTDKLFDDVAAQHRKLVAFVSSRVAGVDEALSELPRTAPCDRMKRPALECFFSKLKHYSTLRKLDAKLRVLNLFARYTDEKLAAAQAEAQRKRGERLVDERLADVSDQLRRATSASESLCSARRSRSAR